MRYHILLSSLVLFLWGVGCQPKTTIAQKTTTPTISSSNQQRPPGTAEATVQIMAVFEEDQRYTCRVKIIQPLGYGVSTPLLPPEKIIRVVFPKLIIEQLDVDQTLTVKLMAPNTISGDPRRPWKAYAIQ